MPIDREDGRHDCSPTGEIAGADGIWVCPGCKQSWTFIPTEMLWLHTDQVESHSTERAEQLAVIVKEVTEGGR